MATNGGGTGKRRGNLCPKKFMIAKLLIKLFDFMFYYEEEEHGILDIYSEDDYSTITETSSDGEYDIVENDIDIL